MFSSIFMVPFVLTACDRVGEENTDESEETVETQPDSELDENTQEEVSDEEENSTDDASLSIDLEEEIFDPNSIAVLTNKVYSLSEEDVPEDLVTIEVPTVLENPEIRQLREEAAEALHEMFAEAEEEEVILYARSGYRSYQTQEQVFENNVASRGEEEANQVSARPGESEHQTGLAMDVTSESVDYQLTAAFGETSEGRWVSENAHRFGYIIRYPEGATDITGYTYEPWHLRYLGEELATAVYDSGVTYEEFLYERGLDIEIGQ